MSFGKKVFALSFGKKAFMVKINVCVCVWGRKVQFLKIAKIVNCWLNIFCMDMCWLNLGFVFNCEKFVFWFVVNDFLLKFIKWFLTLSFTISYYGHILWEIIFLSFYEPNFI